VRKLTPGGQRCMRSKLMCFVLLMIVAVSSAWGIDPVPNSGCGAEVLVLTPVKKLHQNNSGPVIIDGQPASPDQYPVSFLLSTAQGKCTFFLISARTLMTAAHCASNGSLIRIQEDRTTVYEGQCERAPQYPSDLSQDWALCLLSKDYLPPIVGAMPPVFYEVLNTDPSALQIGQRVQITGFGCHQEGGTIDNIYRVGWAEIAELPGDVLLPHSKVETPNALMISKRPSQLCAGDSGGPAFVIDEDSPSFRWVIGINAQTSYTTGFGFLASTSTKDALDFLNEWSKKHDEKICGLHADAKDCRPTKPLRGVK
jgi:Trypsin